MVLAVKVTVKSKVVVVIVMVVVVVMVVVLVAVMVVVVLATIVYTMHGREGLTVHLSCLHRPLRDPAQETWCDDVDGHFLLLLLFVVVVVVVVLILFVGCLLNVPATG